jgi:excisionase family DNA binding protein
MNKDTTEPRMYSAEEVAKIVNMSYFTIIRWIKHGTLKAHKLGESRSSRWRIPESEVIRLRGE